MSWAAGRVTERIEDRAYSLLGIFNVTLEMVYGDREKAFMRLQEKIIQQSADQSIFAWQLDSRNHPGGYSGLLAPSPDSFASSGNIISLGEADAFSLTNIGMSITLEIVPYSMNVFKAYLNCTDRRHNSRARNCILLSTTNGKDHYARVMNSQDRSLFIHTPDESSSEWRRSRKLFIRQIPTELKERSTYGFRLRGFGPFTEYGRIQILSRNRNAPRDYVCLNEGTYGTAGVISVTPRRGHRDERTSWARIRWIKLGFDFDFLPVLMIASEQGSHIIGTGRWRFPDWMRSYDSRGLERSDIFESSWLHQNESTEPSAADKWAQGYYIWTARSMGPAYDGLIKLRDLNVEIRLSRRFSAASGETIWSVEFCEYVGPSAVMLRRQAQVIQVKQFATRPLTIAMVIGLMSRFARRQSRSTINR